MQNSRLSVFWILLVFVVGLPVAAQTESSQDDSNTRHPIRATDRLFLSFAEEATLVDRQWWEGQGELQDGTGFDAKILRAVAAFQPWAQVEFGGRVGFGDTSSGVFPDGSGATDLDLWAKYHFGSGGNTEFAAGAIATVPTGDDAVGLGFDAFSFGAFGSLRHHGDRFVLAGNIGVEVNGDGQQFGNPSFNGETSFSAGVGILIPANDRLTFVGEVRLETERFAGLGSDTRLLGGINLSVGQGRVFRAALTLGLTDGAPDTQLIAGYAATF
ncbi:MAG: hypothetical protein IH848_07290 [Acidobacteria bacterium]|nr:hypothetical protein [Acidobacteriota bacterium]